MLCSFYVVRALLQSIRIPLAPRRAKEIPTIDVNRACKLPRRVGHGMNDGFPQNRDVYPFQLFVELGHLVIGLPPPGVAPSPSESTIERGFPMTRNWVE